MKASAKAKRLTSAVLGERLGVEDGAVRNWWRGHSEPSLDMLRAYADLVGVSADYLISGHDDAFVRWVFRFADAIMTGVAPAQAIEDLSERAIPAEKREALNSRREALREHLQEMAGRPWEELAEADRRAIVERLIQELGP